MRNSVPHVLHEAFQPSLLSFSFQRACLCLAPGGRIAPGTKRPQPKYASLQRCSASLGKTPHGYRNPSLCSRAPRPNSKCARLSAPADPLRDYAQNAIPCPVGKFLHRLH